MIGDIRKGYKITCGECLIVDDLFSDTKKECEDEAKRLGWIKVFKIGWICTECQLKRSEEE